MNMNMKMEPTPGLATTSRGPAHIDYDLVCELMHRQEAFRRCDQYIASPEFPGELQEFWEAIKTQETRNLKRHQESLAGRSSGLLLLLPDPPLPAPPSPKREPSLKALFAYEKSHPTHQPVARP